MTAGLSAWAVAALVWTYYEAWLGVEPHPLPPVAHAGFLLFPICAGVALLCFSPGSGRSRVRLFLDAAMVATSLFVVSWVSVLGRAFDGPTSRFSPAMLLAYVGVDAVLVAIATLVWAGARPVHRTSLGLLVGGVILMAVADISITFFMQAGGRHTDNLIDLTRFAAFGLLGSAALVSIREPPAATSPIQIPSGARLWLPYVPLVLALAVWLGHVLAAVGPALVVMAVLFVVTGLGRTFVALVENQRLLSDVARLAFRDQLTGLANRTLFLDRLEQAVARHRRDGVPLAVICLDLDDFKAVNDDLGHPAGDELLVRVAGRLTGCVRGADTVARLGGDEFAVLIEGPLEGSLTAANRILDSFS